MQCEGPAACPKKYEIERRLILDVFQYHSLKHILRACPLLRSLMGPGFYSVTCPFTYTDRLVQRM